MTLDLSTTQSSRCRRSKRRPKVWKIKDRSACWESQFRACFNDPPLFRRSQQPTVLNSGDPRDLTCKQMFVRKCRRNFLRFLEIAGLDGAPKLQIIELRPFPGRELASGEARQE